MEYAVIYLILMFAISVSVLSILFASNRISRRNKRVRVKVDALKLLKVDVEIDRTPPNEKIHKNSE